MSGINPNSPIRHSSEAEPSTTVDLPEEEKKPDLISDPNKYELEGDGVINASVEVPPVGTRVEALVGEMASESSTSTAAADLPEEESSEFEPIQDPSEHALEGAKVKSLMRDVTSQPDVQAEAGGSKGRIEGDDTTRRYGKLYKKAEKSLGGKDSGEVKVRHGKNIFKSYTFQVTREEGGVVIVPKGKGSRYKGLFSEGSTLGEGSFGEVKKTDALFVQKTGESSLAFKKVSIAIKRGKGEQGKRDVKAGLAKSKKLKGSSHDSVMMSEFSVGKDASAQRLGKTSLVQGNDFDVGRFTLQERMGLGRDVIRGTGQLNRVGLKHYDQKPDNVLLDEKNRAKIIDIDGDLYLPSTKGRTPAELDEDMPLSDLKKDWEEMGLVAKDGEVASVVLTPEFHTSKGVTTAWQDYKAVVEELAKASVWTVTLVEKYNKLVKNVDDSVKRATCITALGIVFNQDVMGNGDAGRPPMPGFFATRLGRSFYVNPVNTKEGLSRILTSALFSENGNKPLSKEQEALIDVVVRVFYPNPGEDTPSYEELEAAFSICV